MCLRHLLPDVFCSALLVGDRCRYWIHTFRAPRMTQAQSRTVDIHSTMMEAFDLINSQVSSAYGLESFGYTTQLWALRLQLAGHGDDNPRAHDTHAGAHAGTTPLWVFVGGSQGSVVLEVAPSSYFYSIPVSQAAAA